MNAPGWWLRRPRRVQIMALAAVVAIAGCSAVLGIQAERHVVIAQDASLEGAAEVPDGATDAGPGVTSAPPGWECINDPPPVAGSNEVQLRITFRDVQGSSANSTGTPMAGLRAHACNRLDPSCVSPFGETVTNDAGTAAFTLDPSFDGFFEVRADNYSPAILARTQQLVSESAEQGMVDVSLLNAGAALVGITQDDTLAVALISVSDCTPHPAGGITFEIGNPGPNEEVVYVEDRLPTRSATHTDDQSGTAVVFNVPPGTVSVTARFAADGRAIRTVSTIARRGWLTFVQVRLDQAQRTPL